MIRKIFFATLLSIFFSCVQCFAAPNDYIEICKKDPRAFVAAFNQAANENGGTFILGAITVSPNENPEETHHIYEVAVVPEGLKVLTYLVANENDFVNRILIVTDNEENSTRAIKPALLALGLTAKEINFEPTFETTEILNSVWCAATNRYVNLITAKREDKVNVFYTIIWASLEDPTAES